MYNLKEKNTGFESPEDGRYLLKVESVEVKPHEKNGKNGHDFGITFVSADGKFKGRVWDHIYLPWATWKMAALLDAAGSTEAGNENATPETIASALQGLKVSGYLETSAGTNGKLRTNVKEYKSLETHASVQTNDYEESSSDLR
jgi:hypothetical protein